MWLVIGQTVGSIVRWGLPDDPGTIEPTPEVLDKLEHAVRRHAAILVHAPAGSGKTTVIARWARLHPERHLVWLEAGGMLGTWSDLLQLFATAIGVKEEGRRDPIPWLSIVERLAVLARPLVVVVDRADEVSGDLNLARTVRALEQLPGVTVVFVTRVGLEAASTVSPTRLVTISARDLEWTTTTARRVLAMRAVSVPAPVLSALVSSTEGRALGVLDGAARWVAQHATLPAEAWQTVDRLVAEWLLERATEAAGEVGVRVVLAVGSLLELRIDSLDRLTAAVPGMDAETIAKLVANGLLTMRSSVLSDQQALVVPAPVMTELGTIALERDAEAVRSLHELAAEERDAQ